jgi:hypothetical protein
MRKIINGVIYDTATATIDKKFTFGLPGDPSGYEETVYITPAGHYFLYTNGGIDSKYPSESIFPIAREDIKSWVFSH